MTNFLLCVVFSVFLLPLKPISAFPPSGLDFGGSRTQRDVHCSADLEYWHNNICCLNCPAGTHVKLACTSLEKKSQCEDCDYGTYTEHANGLPQCFKCTQCRSDQEIVRHCTTTQDAQCQCKPGWFCAPDQACEVCKRCSKCKKDEVIARNCTSTTDTECKEMQHNTGSVSANIVVILPIVLVILLITIVAIVILFLLQRKRCCAADSQNNNPAEVKAGEEDERLSKLYPVNGEVSLKKCFEYFEEIDINYHKRFFRHLGINDNVIKSHDHLPYEDRIHELLTIWVEKEGRDASLNDLLKALCDLNQRRTAETVMEIAVRNGHYVCEP
ncbi:hematopoietic death receptor isoform X3 [Channa argus]|uniref:hematopoietic death receptor isoform X3 n=1 Tax=Channa argus TaxID=215402 RepID=UPI003520A526